MKVKPPGTLHEFATGTRRTDPVSRWTWFRLIIWPSQSVRTVAESYAFWCAQGGWRPGEAWPGLKRLAHETGLHRVTIIRARKTLIEIGVLERTGHSRFYRVRCDVSPREINRRIGQLIKADRKREDKKRKTRIRWLEEHTKQDDGADAEK